MQKQLWIVLLSIFIIGCNNANQKSINSNTELPSISSSSKTTNLEKESISDINSIKSQANTLSFAYYTANRLTKEGNKRWYISQINGGLKGYVFSLMPIVNDKAGWGEVGKDVASLDIYQNNIKIGYIADNPTYEYKDWGLGTMQTNPIIQEDIELIRNSTVDIKWWFFKASNNSWYIVNQKSIYKFASKDGIYDWQKIDIPINLSIEFFIEDGLKKMRLIESNTEVPQLNLNHKSETKEIKKRTGCDFNDIYPNMFSTNRKEENYIRAICQAGIMQGVQIGEQTYNFEPFEEVTRDTVSRVSSLVYNYDEVIKFCSQSKYEDKKFNCYVDYAKEKGLEPIPTAKLRKYEFYRYLIKLYWNRTIVDKYEAWKFLKDKGVLLKAPIDEYAGQLYVPDFMENRLQRWELATLVMRCSRLVKEENSNHQGGELPYSITPDNKEISDVEILKFLEDLFTEIFEDDPESLAEINATLFNDDKADEREESFFIPKNSLPKAVNIKETPTDELPNAIVETAKENIGKQSPYTDTKKTIDTRLITTVYGQDVKYDSAKDMCKDYEEKGKMDIGLPTDKDLKGYVVCYDENTKGTKGKGHVAIIVDSKGEKEIGVQDTKHGVMERPTDKENIKGVIAPEKIELPNFN